MPKQNQYRVLQERLEGLIRNKLCRLREVPRPPAIDLAIPHTLLEELFKAANKAPTKRHLGIIASVCWTRLVRGVSRCSVGMGCVGFSGVLGFPLFTS